MKPNKKEILITIKKYVDHTFKDKTDEEIMDFFSEDPGGFFDEAIWSFKRNLKNEEKKERDS